MSIYHFKILVPAAAAGRIIGKGGTTIAQLQKDAGARVKMSKASEFYPGTTERVCLISGPIEGILKINDFFMESFSSTSIKILVPNSTAGMIIGKGGSYIKQIKEQSGAYVQISQKCTDLSLPERCVTVVGELENIRKACTMILNKIVEDVGSAFRDIRASSMTASMFSTSSSSSPSSTHSPQPHQMSLNHNNNNNSNHNINHNHFHNQHHHQHLSSSSMNSTLISPPTNNITTTAGRATSSPNSLLASCSNSAALSNIVETLTPDHLIAAAVGGGGLPVAGSTNSISPPISLRSPPASPTILSTTSGGGGSNTISPLSNSHTAAAAAAVAATTNSSSSSSVWSDMNSAQIIETIKLVLRVSGYGEDAVSEISSAMSTLSNYGVLGVGLGLL